MEKLMALICATLGSILFLPVHRPSAKPMLPGRSQKHFP
jgi:hypothetical protein